MWPPRPPRDTNGCRAPGSGEGIGAVPRYICPPGGRRVRGRPASSAPHAHVVRQTRREGRFFFSGKMSRRPGLYLFFPDRCVLDRPKNLLGITLSFKSSIVLCFGAYPQRFWSLSNCALFVCLKRKKKSALFVPVTSPVLKLFPPFHFKIYEV